MRLRSTRLTAIANAIRDKFYGAALNMRFDNTTSLDSRVTFSRTTNATLTNSSGLIANAPMNLLTHSEQFDNAAWTKTNTTVTANSAVAPDGATTGDAVIESLDVAVTNHQISLTTPFAFVSGVAYTNSVFAKPANGVRSLRLAFPSAAFGSAPLAYFDLQNGTVLSGTGASIASVGNGWFRCSYTQTATATASSSFLTVGMSQGTTRDYVGDGTSGIYVWGAQLELGSTATTYNPTTVKNLLGFTENFDNAAWPKSNSFVQTNLVINSVFANTGGAAPTSYTQSFGTGTSAPSGTASNGNVIYTQTATAQRPLISQAITTVVGVVYTSSMTITEASGLTVADVIGASGVVSTYTLNGASVLGTALASPGVVTATWTAAATASGARFGIGVVGNATGSISFHGAQLVQGTSAGDYKATYAAAAAVGYTDIYGQPFAQKLVESTANSVHRVGQSSGVIGSTETFSAYAKAAERSWMVFQLGSSSVAYFNLANGTLGNVSGGTATITAVGDGWYRCSITGIRATNLNNIIFMTTGNGTVTYTGDGTSGIYIFGAQLSDSASVDPYVYQPVAAPTSTAYYGPRFDYDPVTLAPKGLLIEEQRTNLLLQSETFENASWTKTNSTVTANQAIAPDGALTADKYIPINTGNSDIRQNLTFASSVYTASIFVNLGDFASGGLSFFLAGTAGANGAVNIQTGSVISSGANFISGGSQPVGNGWYRVYATINNTFVGASSLRFSLTDTSGNLIPGDGTSGIFIYGAQLEVGSFATSYIPTVASQVTRAADSASMIGNNFARWYNQTEGTLFVQGITSPRTTAVANAEHILSITSTLSMLRGASSVSLGWFISSATFRSFNFTNASALFKSAGAYLAGDNAATLNGGSLVTDAGSTFGSPASLFIGANSTGILYMNGHISRIAYYNRRLANTELQAITR